jgi:hypothetical protein
VTLQVESSDVWIPPNMKVVLDVSTPPLGHLIVQGSLFINSTTDVTMTATYIEIRGGSLIVAEVVNHSNLNVVCSKLSWANPDYPHLRCCIRQRCFSI